MTANAEMKFEAPGPGPWEADTAHYTKPVTHFMRAPIVNGMPRGFSTSTERYGVLLSHFQPAIVNGFYYHQPVAFGAPKGANGPPPKIILQLLTRLHPKMRARIRTSKEAIEQKRWREDLERWDSTVKPRSIARHATMRAIDPATLSLEALTKHLRECAQYAEDMIEQHHIFTITSMFPIGDFLAHATRWTKKSAHEVLTALRGSSPVSNGAAAHELHALASALAANPTELATLKSTKDAAAALRDLMAQSTDLGQKARAYLDLVGYRSTGYDLSEPMGWEMPDMLLRGILAAVDKSKAPETASPTNARIQELRNAVPEEHRALFDELLEEARHVNRLRDERGVYSDGTAVGLIRRALLEAGSRLVAEKRLHHAASAIDLTCDEVVALLEGKTTPTADEVAARTKFRQDNFSDSAPPFLNAQPAPPPPAAWLPEAARRPALAVEAAIAALFVELGKKESATQVSGIAVSPGVYEGTARLVSGPDDFALIQQGDVLVTRATSPYFNVVLPLLGAIVTDRGGSLSHAAIVAREYGIPGVVGTREGTSLIKNGARVRVDGNAGAVTVIG